MNSSRLRVVLLSILVAHSNDHDRCNDAQIGKEIKKKVSHALSSHVCRQQMVLSSQMPAHRVLLDGDYAESLQVASVLKNVKVDIFQLVYTSLFGFADAPQVKQNLGIVVFGAGILLQERSEVSCRLAVPHAHTKEKRIPTLQQRSSGTKRASENAPCKGPLPFWLSLIRQY
jgi:hypothetical protein